MGSNLGDSLEKRLEGASDEALVEELFAFIDEHGQSNYDEAVTQKEHALQCADLAQQRGWSDEAVTAALLHDLGHLLLEEDNSRKDFLHEDHDHETVAARMLEKYFPPAVTEPIRLHVAAKRYLCTVDPTYHDQLSLASQRSYQVQGGRLSAEEQAELDACPELETALDLRRLDDLGKSPGKSTPALRDFRDCVLRSLRAARSPY